MPRRGQVGVTIPKYIWNYLTTYFEKHKKELEKRGIRSPTRLLYIKALESLSKNKEEYELSCFPELIEEVEKIKERLTNLERIVSRLYQPPKQ